MASAGLLVAPASAQTPPDIKDLLGARAAGGETQMQARGYTNVGGQTGDDRVWTYWWNPSTRTCVTVATVQGRYDSITVSPAPDCQRQGAATPPPSAPTQTAQSGDHWFDLGLICFGEGKKPVAATQYGYSWDYDKGRYVYGNHTELTTQDFDASVTIQIWDGGGRIRLPNKLIPPIHSRGDQGWWELDDVVAGRDTITAGYRLNGLNKPKIVIDRRSGRISIRGTSDYAFSGSCDTVDNPQRRF
ncbi:hypothetical protein [Sphingomonas sp. DBB INV C78]|uniref:hypothetical protein n=1 Tax=Sphingomonas sp. DBB INV C78 TaxID=3349434 RepID=UPI0036D39F69